MTSEDIDYGERGDVLTISTDQACFVLVKLRELAAKVEVDDPQSGSNPTDDRQIDILEDLKGDATLEELLGATESLNKDEQVDLLGLVWLGRGDFDGEDWGEALVAAREAHNEQFVQYLVGTPLAADYLEEGLNRLGFSCEDIEKTHL